MTYTRVFPVFSIAFAIIYLFAEQSNWALVTYHPRIGEWDWLTKPSRSGPAMHWFGWVGTSILGATAVSLTALALPQRWQPPVWIGWAVPLAVMIAFVYLFKHFFLR